MDKMNRKKDKNIEMDEWLTEEYLEEAERIIQEVMEKDDVLPDDQIDMDGSYERLMAKMNARGLKFADGEKQVAHIVPMQG